MYLSAHSFDLTTTSNDIDLVSGVNLNLTSVDGSIDLTCQTTSGTGAINLTAGGHNDGSNVITLNAPYGKIDITSGVEINLDSSGSIIGSAVTGMDFDTGNGYFNAGDTFGGNNKTTINIVDSISQINLQCPAGTVQIGDVNTDVSGNQFIVNSAEQYFTSNGGQASRCDEITTALTQIEMFNNFITSNVDVELKAPASYLNGLNGPNGEGWFCYIQNISSGNITISSAVGTDFVFGALLASFVIGPYTTRRFTLTYWTNDGVYYWSVL
jgi:hypothetical protein